MSGIKTDWLKNKLHTGDQVSTHIHIVYTHAHTHRQWHINEETQREREERRIKTANIHHRRRYCIIGNVTFGEENTNETYETNTN